MIATQVAGKAARDSLFLTNFHVSALPTMLIVSAAFSIVAALVAARAMTVYGPARVVPPCFVASGLLLLAEWWLAGRSPRPAAVLVYLHIAALGSILISGFWSLVDEIFDPRSAKRGFGRIMGAATAGGLFGGLIAERVGSVAGVLSILPVIAGLHFVCAFLIPRFSHASAAAPGSFSAMFKHRHKTDDESGFSVLRRVGYLRSLALIVLLGNVAATLLDYVFKARATATFTDSAELVRFFALFYTVVSVLTLAVQTGMTRRLLESIGIARTVAVRPALVIVGGVVSLPVAGLLSVGVVRGLEMVVQSSLFRAGYELLFTPVVPADKRRTKTVVDVGADRMGDIVGGALIRLGLLLPVAFVDHTLLALVIVISLASLAVARMLHAGYVRALEQSLIHRAGAIDASEMDVPGLRTIMLDSATGIDFTMTGVGLRLDELRDRSGSDTEPGTRAASNKTPTPVGALVTTDPELSSLIELRSGDPRRVRDELHRNGAITPVIATQMITLLAWDEMSGRASHALVKAVPSITGQLIDRMLDRDEEFAVRRRIPRILAAATSRRAVDGLSAALADERFEVRYQAARALARIYERSASLGVDNQLVYSMVSVETHVDRRLWNEQRLIDEPDATEDPALIDPSVRGRAGRRMEHVFTLLSLVLPREPLRIAYKGLLTTDAVLRATGLEYLESVLPREIWSTLYPLLDESPHEPAAPARPREQVLENLMRSTQSIELNLAEIRKNIPDR